MQTLNYTTNPNGKLLLDIWNDIRLADADKFYPGAQLEICIKNKPIGIAEVIVVKKFHFKFLNDIMAYVDIGKPLQYLAKLLKNYYGPNNVTSDTVFDHLILKWIKRDIGAQEELLQAWWNARKEEAQSQQNKTV